MRVHEVSLVAEAPAFCNGGTGLCSRGLLRTWSPIYEK